MKPLYPTPYHATTGAASGPAASGLAIHIPKKIVEAKPLGPPGAKIHWIAKLEDSTVVVGYPSWLSSGSPLVTLPHAKTGPQATDWRRLMERCAENRSRIVSLSLTVPGHSPICAPDNCSAYGYYETVVGSVGGGKTTFGVQSVHIVWEQVIDGVTKVKGLAITAGNELAGFEYPGRLKCMIARD